MKFNSMKITGLALLSALSLSACKPDKEEELPIVTALVSGAVQSAGSGDCAISINATGLYYGTILNQAVGSNAGTFDAAVNSGAFRTHYNVVYSNAQAASAADLNAAPINLKFDAFFATSNSAWTDASRASYLNALDTTARTTTTLGTTLQSTLVGLRNIQGVGILTCSRIPRSSCNFASFSVASRVADIAAQVAAANQVLSTPECRKTPATNLQLKSTALTGLPTTEAAVAFSDGTFTSTNAGANGAFTNNSILATSAYPKSGTLVSLGFGTLMPLRNTGTNGFALTSSALTLGPNITVTPVTSCESLGLADRGISQTASASSLPLTPKKEIAYAFSTSGAGAALYATAVGASIGMASQATQDAIQCNRGLRSAFRVPLALNQGGKLDDIAAISGNGGATTTLTACLYGQNATTRSTASTIFGNLGISGLVDCPAGAASAANAFPDTGFTTDASNVFPNGR